MIVLSMLDLIRLLSVVALASISLWLCLLWFIIEIISEIFTKKQTTFRLGILCKLANHTLIITGFFILSPLYGFIASFLFTCFVVGDGLHRRVKERGQLVS